LQCDLGTELWLTTKLTLLPIAFEYVSELITGSEGLFGIDGPLFGSDGPLHGVAQFFVDKGFLGGDGEWSYDGFERIVYGTDGDDFLIHDGWGEVYGGKSDDVLVGLKPIFIAAGSPMFDDTSSPVAPKDQQLELDGGC
jgi:hypothetical protein